MFIGGYQIWDWTGVDLSIRDTFSVPTLPANTKRVVITNASLSGEKMRDVTVDVSSGKFDVGGKRITYDRDANTVTVANIPTPYTPSSATTSKEGLVKQAANVSNIADPMTMTSEANAIVINAVLSALKTAGIMAPDEASEVLTQSKRKVNN